MICKKCGVTIPNNGFICPNCGAHISVGFNDEITPFVEENTMLRAKLEERGYQPTLKPGA